MDVLEPAIHLLALLVSNPTVADEAVYGGVFLLLRTVLQRFCSDPAKPCPSMLGGVATVAAGCVVAPGVVGPEGAERLAAARDIYRRIIRAAGTAAPYTDEAVSVKAVLRLIVRACKGDPAVPGHVTAGNKAEAMECGTEDLIVLGMSSSAAEQDTINLGSEALQAIGAGSRAERLKKVRVTVCARIVTPSGLPLLCVCGVRRRWTASLTKSRPRAATTRCCVSWGTACGTCLWQWPVSRRAPPKSPWAPCSNPSPALSGAVWGRLEGPRTKRPPPVIYWASRRRPWDASWPWADSTPLLTSCPSPTSRQP